MKHALAAFLALAIAAPATAQTYRATNNMRVDPAGGTQFVVSGVPRLVPQDYWCAAGRYAQRVLKVSPNSRLYVVGNYQRGQRSVTFSTSPAGTAAANGKVSGISTRIDGVNRKVDAAVAECYGTRFFSR